MSMKSTRQAIIIIPFMISMSTTALAQTDNWKTEVTDDGRVTVKSRFSKRMNEKGDILPLIEYTATTTASVDMNSCISVLRDVSNHKKFMRDVKVAKRIREISPNESIVYYDFAAPWPFSDYDCVATMTSYEDTVEKTAAYSLTATPSMYERTDEDRLSYYNITYAFKDLGGGNVEIAIDGKMSPMIDIPLWILRRSMPSHPAEVLQKIINLANHDGGLPSK